VVDASAPEEEIGEMARAVEDVLDEIGAGDRPRVLVLNKADLLDDEQRRAVAHRHRDAVLVSAATGDGLETLAERIEIEFLRTLRPVELLLPYDEGGRIAELHELAGELERTDTPDGVLISARLPVAVAARFDRYTAPPDGNGRR
jgi:GTP-binding protein HflX